MFLRAGVWHSTAVVVVFAFVLVLQNFFPIVYIFICSDLLFLVSLYFCI